MLSCDKMVRKALNRTKVEVLEREKSGSLHHWVFIYSSHRPIVRYMWGSAYKIFLINRLILVR